MKRTRVAVIGAGDESIIDETDILRSLEMSDTLRQFSLRAA